MRLAFVTDKCWPFARGGYERRIWELSRRLARKHEVRVYTSLDQKVMDIENVTFVNINPAGTLFEHAGGRSITQSVLFSLRLFREIARGWKPDIMIVEAIPYLHLATMSGWVSKCSTLKVLSIDEAWLEFESDTEYGNPLVRSVVNKLLRRGLAWSDLNIAVSPITMKSLKEGFHAVNLALIPNGVDTSFYEGVKSATGRPAEKQYDFVSVGRLVSSKRHADILDAAAVLLHRHSWNGKIAVVGAGPTRRSLEARVSSLGLEGHVELLGELSDWEKARTLLDSRSFLLASEREGFSIATLEAMACGLPIISALPRYAEVAGQSFLVKDGVTGLCYEVGNIAQLVNRMERLLEDQSLRTLLGKAGAILASNFDWDRIANELSDLLADRLGI